MNGTSRRAAIVYAGVVVATAAQLAVATLLPDLPQFAGKAFGARLVFYPLLMLLAPASWWAIRHLRHGGAPIPWAACAWIALPFLVDVTGNTLDLYDTVTWWDDLNHLVNWVFLCLGVGLLLDVARLRPVWALGLATAGAGALLAVGWELAEWWTFIRHGTELATAYEDTLGDLVLGTSGGILAAVVLALRRRGA
jgi:hypothetical protein